MLQLSFIPHAVQISTGAPVTGWISQIESYSVEGGVTLFEETNGSAVDREFVAARDVAPTMQIITSDLTALSTVGYNGLAITPTPGVVAYGRALPNGSTPTALASTVHLKMACSDGLLVPVSLHASHNQAAKLNYVLHGTLGTGGSSGATPFVWTASSAIATGATATANVYTTGPVKYTAGSARLVQGIKSSGVEFGLSLLKESDTGEVNPTRCSIIGRNSKLEFLTDDAELATEVGDGLSVTAFSMYFRQVAASGQRVAPGTATHVSVAGTAGMITPGSTMFRHKQAGQYAMTYTPALNTNQLVISTTATIPTS